MAFDATPPRNDYIGTGGLATYAYTFRIFASSDLRLTKRNTAGVETPLVLTTDYTVTGVNKAAGGTITLLAGNLPADFALTIRFDRTPQQSTDLRNQGGFFMETIENKVDEVTRYCQQIIDKVARSIHIPETEVGTEAKTGLPSATLRSGKFLSFDGSGNVLMAAGTSADLTPVSGFINTLLDDVDAATARATLDASKTEPLDSIFRVVGSGDASKKLAVEVDGLTTATTRTLTAQDKDGTITITAEFAYSNLAGSPGRQTLPAMWMQGLTYQNNAGDAANDLDIVAGQCRDATNAHNLIGAALTKQSDVAWAVGTNGGMLDTGAVGNSDYYLWAIKRSDTGVVDYLSSLSSTAPTMPASYDFKRLIGWFKRVGGAIVLFHTYETEGGGLHLAWDAPTLDINLAATLTTARRTDAVKVPLDFSVVALLNTFIDDASTLAVWIYCPDQTDLVPSFGSTPLGNQMMLGGIGLGMLTQMQVRTSAAGLIAARSSVASVNTYAVSTMGFTWARR